MGLPTQRNEKLETAVRSLLDEIEECLSFLAERFGYTPEDVRKAVDNVNMLLKGDAA